ncbi:MAG: RIP metalloprotease RseP [Fuerstiella sp.]|nr:RIP metalloprotease RseP [Fuerstiella sp.]
MIISSLITLAAGGVFGSIGKALMVVLGLGLVIFFHELGHFAVAKWCNVHVERFSIGIGPILWSRQKGETEYALSALPLGGYVKMLGQDDMDPNQMTSDEIAENPRAYSAKKVWQRMLIISAGVIMNIITGFGFFSIAYNMGVHEVLPVVGLAVPGSPAWEAGIKRGDRIRAINGEEVHSFIDIKQTIVLSSGPVEIEGTTENGVDYTKTVTPLQGKQFRQIGVNPSKSLRISPQAGKDYSIAISGFPSARASTPFEPGDRVVSLNGTELKSWHQLSRLTARHAADELVYSVERTLSEEEKPLNTQNVDITVPPGPVRSIGLWMHIGPVESVQANSIAAKARLEKGDVIRKVDDLEVGVDIDPLRLPNYFADRAGTTVRISVVRKKDGSIGEVDEELTLVPVDNPGWSEFPVSLTAPLPIPAIGAAFGVSTTIAKVIDGSEVAGITDPGKLKPDQRITKIVLPYKEDDGLGTASDEAAIFELPEDSEANWAHIFYMIQQAPLRDIRIHIDGSTDSDSFSVLLQKREIEENWYLPIRGIRGFEDLSEKRVAYSTGEAVQLGVRQTRNSIVNIYMTLRSLVRGDLSAKALSGPLGILSIGYQVADSGLAQLLTFLGLLSINLAVLNFLPIPILDGGHMVFLIWEGVTRRKPSPRVIGLAHIVGLCFIIFLFCFVMYLDVVVRFLGFGAD